ncbi:MAG: hypothetical protein IH900_13905, partial [Proteobacteria bacterium]|nr:hypothetical protein [Pseudomonadota bacterium]
ASCSRPRRARRRSSNGCCRTCRKAPPRSPISTPAAAPLPSLATFPLAGRARVHAVERDEAAMAALWSGARKADLAGRITVETRDLARAPVTAEELAGGDCVVFDPPRAGAREQAAEIARSSVPAAIAVSCNPNTFARDARTLVDGGFTLVEVSPIDQFPWTGHLELVASFRR